MIAGVSSDFFTGEVYFLGDSFGTESSRLITALGGIFLISGG